MTRKRSRTALFLGLAFSVAGTAQAAAPTPGTILRQTTPPPALPSAPPPVLNLPSPKQQRSRATTPIPVKRLVLEGNTLIPSSVLMPLVKDVEGKTVTLGQLNTVVGRITTYYRSHGYPLASAYLPAQTISDGVVHVAVVEPRYDQVSIQGHSRLANGQAERTLGLQSGAPIEEAPLQRGLLLLNQTPGVKVAGTLVPGAKPATSSLDVRLTDTPRVRGDISVDDFGNTATGRARTQADLSLDNPFGYGGQIAVNGLATQGGLLKAGGVSLLSPNLYRGLRLSLYGSHTDYRLGGDFASLDQTGTADQYGVGITYPLILEPGRQLSVRLDTLRNRFEQKSGAVSLDDRSRINLTRLTLNGAFADRTGGVTSGGISVSHGKLAHDSASAKTIDATGPNAAGRFWVSEFELQHSRPLPLALSFQANLSGQLASKNLDGSQKFSVDGPYGVMSYPVGEATGDSGLLLRLKLSHAIPLAVPGQLDAAVLAQYGQVWLNRNTYPGAADPNRIHLGGAGLGLNYRWNRLTARVDYVHRVGSKPALTGSVRKYQVWASLRLDL